jgi:hypothetical protein
MYPEYNNESNSLGSFKEDNEQEDVWKEEKISSPKGFLLILSLIVFLILFTLLINFMKISNPPKHGNQLLLEHESAVQKKENLTKTKP